MGAQVDLRRGGVSVQRKQLQKLRPKELLHIVLDDFDFSWTKKETDKFMELYRADAPIWEMARKLKREQVEVALLIMDFELRGRIEPRVGGVYGGVA